MRIWSLVCAVLALGCDGRSTTAATPALASGSAVIAPDAPRSPWQVVLDQITSWEDAVAVMQLFEYRDDVLYANETSIEILGTAAVLSERELAGLLARRLEVVTGRSWQYTDLYSPTRSRDATSAQIDTFVERCRAAGVTLSHRARRADPG